MSGRKVGHIGSTTLTKLIQHLVDTQPDQELFVFYKGEIRTAFTSRQLFELAGKFAHRLRHQYGLSQGDVVANTLPNSPERLLTSVGITFAGCVELNGQILLTDGEDFFLNLRRSKAKAVILSPKETSPAWRLIKPYVGDFTSPCTAQLSGDRAPDLETAITVSRETFRDSQPFLEDLDKSDNELFVESSVTSEDTVIIMTTSGSTGYSKLVAWSHQKCIDFWTEIYFGESEFATHKSSTEVLYNDRPMGWGGGHPVLTYLTGCKRAMLDAFEMTGLRTGQDMWRVISQERCTEAVILPLDLDNVVVHVRQLGGNQYKLKKIFSGAQPIKKSQITDMKTIAEEVVLLYGSTEAGVQTVLLVSTAEEYSDFLVGKPFPGVEIKIVDEKSYEECQPGQVGLILCKGKSVFEGYFNLVEQPDPNTAKAFTKDGWFITEDLGYFDENGCMFVIGRNKDVIMYGAVVVYPGWLEKRILGHPDIIDACVVRVSDPVLYHNICACVKPRPGSNLTEEKLKAICKQLFILESESEGVPMPEYFLILDSFPDTMTGKTDKKILTAMAEEKFGHKGAAQP